RFPASTPYWVGFVLLAMAFTGFALRREPANPGAPPSTTTGQDETATPDPIADQAEPAPAFEPEPVPEGPTFLSLFNGQDLAGWTGEVEAFEVKDGLLSARPGRRAVIRELIPRSDFVARIEFLLEPGAEGGLLLRYPGEGDGAYEGMCEIQILDDTFPDYAQIDATAFHGSAYHLAAAQRGHLKPLGQWNVQEVVVRGSTVKVELNGAVILDADLAKIHEFPKGIPHPGKDRTEGFFGLQCGSGEGRGVVRYRTIEIRDLPQTETQAQTETETETATSASSDPSPEPPPEPARPLPGAFRNGLIAFDELNVPGEIGQVGETQVEGEPRPFTRKFENGAYVMEAPGKWTGFDAWNCSGELLREYEVEVVGRAIGPANAKGGWGVILVVPGGRGILVSVNPGGLLGIAPSPWGKESHPADRPLRVPSRHPAVKGAGQWNTMTVRARRRSIEILINGVAIGKPIRANFEILPSTPELAIVKDDASVLRAEFDRVEVVALDRGGTIPADASGRPLNLGFEDGTLRDWTPQGTAVEGQPVEGDTVFSRRADSRSRHDGRFWVGTYEKGGDEATGTLTSVPFKVTQPYASFLVAGGALAKTRVEILDRNGKPVAMANGAGWETLQPVAVDLRRRLGQEITIRLVDEAAVEWGHLNFDDFRFHDSWPRFTTQFASDRPLGPVIYADDFYDKASGWDVNQIDMGERKYDVGVYSYVSQPGWSGASCSEWTTKLLDQEFQVSLSGRVFADSPQAEGGWGMIVGRQDGRGVLVFLDRRGRISLVPSFWGAEAFPNDRSLPPTSHPAVLPPDQWNQLTRRAYKNRVEIFINGQRFGDPFPLGYDLLPATTMLTLVKPHPDPRVRVDFNWVEVREILSEAP
ncbi:MAG: DUF1080 domain-containing protein, partial [Isosphaeraceae bacterium]